MDLFIPISVIILNIALWVVLFANLNRRFDASRFINETRSDLSKTIQEMNSIVERNISLINDRIVELKKVSAEAEKKVLLLNKEIASYDAVAGLEKRINTAYKDYSNSGSKFKSYSQADKILNSESEPQKKYDSSLEQLKESKSEKSTMSIEEEVKQLHLAGLSLDEIASRLSKTLTEVRLILDMM